MGSLLRSQAAEKGSMGTSILPIGMDDDLLGPQYLISRPDFGYSVAPGWLDS
jgi:hypothetical protein